MVSISQIAVHARPIACLTCYIGLVCLLGCAGWLQAQDAGYEKHPRAPGSTSWSPRLLGETFLPDPIFVYNNWSSYDELSDNVLLTEQLAMKELDEIIRLRRFGVRFDYYMMDAFWFAQDGGYKTWRKSRSARITVFFRVFGSVRILWLRSMPLPSGRTR